MDAGWDTHLHVFDEAVPVQPGHYQPAHRPLELIETEARDRLAIGHLVLVQPSVYGQDHAVLLKALERGQGRHRAVVVPGEWLSSQTPRELRALHDLGVRGVRLNCVSPQGEGSDLAAIGQRMQALLPLLQSMGWHLQWYTRPEYLPQIAQWHRGSGVVAVLDHLGGLTPAHRPQASEVQGVSHGEAHGEAHCDSHGDAHDDAHMLWQCLQDLAGQGAWIKLSGWYRLQSVAPHDDLIPVVQRLATVFGDHLLWGSDWPHTLFSPNEQPDLLSTWRPLERALGASAAQEILRGAARLYR